MIKLIKKAFKVFSSIFSRQGAKTMISVLEKTAPIVDDIYPIVRTIAELTPNRIDNEIVEAYDYFGVAELFNPNMDKPTALRNLAQKVVAEELKNKKLASYVLNTAIELAYAKYKEEIESTEE